MKLLLDATRVEDRTAADVAAKPAAGKRRFPLGPLATFQLASFRYLWFGSLFGSGGMWIQQVAVNWLVYDLTNSAAMLAIVNACRTSAWAFTAPVTGMLVDRVDRRKLIMATQLATTAAAVLFATDVALQTVAVWHIMLFTFVVGTNNAINNTTRRAIIPMIVPRSQIVSANAFANASMNLMRAVGPAVGGLLVQFVGMVVNFFLQAGCYIGSLLCTIPVKMPVEEQPAGSRATSLRRSLAEGVDYVRCHEDIRSVLIVGLVATMFVFPIQSLIPVFARDIFLLGADGYGIMLMAVGIGSLVGTLGVASFAQSERKAPLFLALLVVAISAPIAFAWTQSLPAALLFLAVLGACQMAFFSLNQGMQQLLVPNAMLGRVMSVDNLNAALIPLGGVLAGIVADALGAPFAVTAFSVVGLALVVLMFATMPAVRRL